MGLRLFRDLRNGGGGGGPQERRGGRIATDPPLFLRFDCSVVARATPSRCCSRDYEAGGGGGGTRCCLLAHVRLTGALFRFHTHDGGVVILLRERQSAKKFLVRSHSRRHFAPASAAPTRF